MSQLRSRPESSRHNLGGNSSVSTSSPSSSSSPLLPSSTSRQRIDPHSNSNSNSSGATHPSSDAVQNNSNSSVIHPTSSDIWIGEMADDLTFLLDKSWQAYVCSPWYRFKSSRIMLYKQQLEEELMRILPEKRSIATTITHPTRLRYASILGYERQIRQEEPEAIIEQKEAAASQTVQCSITQVAQQAWPPTRKVRGPSTSSSPQNTSNSFTNNDSTPIVLKVSIGARNGTEKSITELVWIPAKEKRCNCDAKFTDMPLLLVHGQAPIAMTILEWWQASFDCRIFQYNWNHAIMSEVFAGWANMILTHRTKFDKLNETIELKYAVPDYISGLNTITIEPEITKFIDCMLSNMSPSESKRNVLSLLHDQFMRCFRIRLNFCRITHMRLDTFYLDKDARIKLNKTEHGNLLLFILGQLAYIAHSANGCTLLNTEK
ncbi:hypothetical protein BDF22DRAFT_678199 [Syncephalis plumigaleata]|nr:hypothetical protein BDF22DRAFT_678199 [Syncephalis plumigaleata]